MALVASPSTVWRDPNVMSATANTISSISQPIPISSGAPTPTSVTVPTAIHPIAGVASSGGLKSPLHLENLSPNSAASSSSLDPLRLHSPLEMIQRHQHHHHQQQSQQQPHHGQTSITSSSPNSGRGTIMDDDNQDIVCVVCSDKSSGKHYGQFTCEGKGIPDNNKSFVPLDKRYH